MKLALTFDEILAGVALGLWGLMLIFNLYLVVVIVLLSLGQLQP